MNQTTLMKSATGHAKPGSHRLPPSLSWPSPLQLVALVFLTVALFAEPFLRLVEVREVNVYHHLEDARRLGELHVLYRGHFIFHAFTAAVHGVLPLSWLQANVVALLALRALLAIIVWSHVRQSLHAADSANHALLAIALTLGLLISSAVSFISWRQGNYYLGYVVPNVYVSQTMVALQPFALLTFFAVIRVLDAPLPGPSRRDVLIMAALTILSTLAKPSYAMVLLPTAATLLFVRRQLLFFVPVRHVGLLIVLGRWCKDIRSVLILGLGLVVPALAAIAWIHVSTFLTFQKLDIGEGSGVRIAPFKVMAFLQSHYASSEHVAVWLAVKLVLSLVFPLAVAVAYFPKVRHDTRFQLAWLQLGFGLIFMYFVAEDPRFAAGNFTWSALIANFILFVVSALLLVEQTLSGLQSRWRVVANRRTAILCYATLLLHVVAGVGIYLNPALN